jgi:hypothetical protein
MVTAHPDGSAASAQRVAQFLAEALGAKLTVYPLTDRLAPIAGVAGIEIPRFAERMQADLVVLPRICFAGELLADAVTRRSRLPSLSVASGCEDLRRWLIALDGSARCRLVLSMVTPMSRPSGHGDLGSGAGGQCLRWYPARAVRGRRWGARHRVAPRRTAAANSGGQSGAPPGERRERHGLDRTDLSFCRIGVRDTARLHLSPCPRCFHPSRICWRSSPHCSLSARPFAPV